MAVFSRRVPHVANIATASHRFHFLGEDETGCLLAFLRLKSREFPFSGHYRAPPLRWLNAEFAYCLSRPPRVTKATFCHLCPRIEVTTRRVRGIAPDTDTVEPSFFLSALAGTARDAAISMDAAMNGSDTHARAFVSFQEHTRNRASGFGGAGASTSAPEVSSTAHKGGSRVAARTSVFLTETYKRCNPQFGYNTHLNPKRQLTKPSKPVGNVGRDNENQDLIISVGDVLTPDDGTGGDNGGDHGYEVRDVLGSGTFGQVVRCRSRSGGAQAAVKVIKNHPAYFHQAHVEIGILHMLNTKCDAGDTHHIVRMLDHFVCASHLCIVFEVLNVNLYELLRQNGFRGLHLKLVKKFTQQLLRSLKVLRSSNIIHCDLKPENILVKSLESGEIKLIDFGSACFENRTVYQYIQSRFYRYVLRVSQIQTLFAHTRR